MKKIQLITYFFATSVLLHAQLKPLDSYSILSNYEKTIHLIFPADVKYHTSVSDFVIIDNPENARNIIRLKAANGRFNKKTTVNVATEDSRFYTFDVNYSDRIKKTNVIVSATGEISSVEPEVIYVNKVAQTHLISPRKIVYFDYGNPETVICDIAENTENIMRITANKDKFSEVTNLSFVTSDGAFYTYDLVFSENPPDFVYQVGEEKIQKAIITGVERKEDKANELNKIKRVKRRIFDIGIVESQIRTSLFNVFASPQKLFLQIEIKNGSTINYDIDFIKFFIEDKRATKKTVAQQIDVEPIYMDGDKSTIEGQTGVVIIIAFDKFTISNRQTFNIHINEKNGGRGVILKVDNKTLSDAINL